MLRTQRLAASVAVAAILSLLGSLPAVACPRGNCDGGSSAGAGGGTIHIIVWGSGVSGGGRGFDVPARELGIQLPCYYVPFWTGKELYEYVEAGRWISGNVDREPTPPPAGWDDPRIREDTEGNWWSGMCTSANWDGSLDGFFDYAEQWFPDNPTRYVFAGDPPPVPTVPPELLVQIAYRELDLPAPEIGWNPQRQGDDATFVNLDTWIWLDESPVQLEVNAQAGTSVARVEATIESMTVSAPYSEPVTCQGTGVPWSPTATGACAIAFGRSSAIHPGQVTPVTVDTHWAIEWFANGAPRGPLEPQTTSGTNPVPVAEVQTIVNGTN
jgi:hypothetical protein